MVTKVATQNNDVVNGTEDADELFGGGFNNVTLNGLGNADRLYADDGTGGEFNGGGGDDYLTAGSKDTDNGPHSGGVFNGGDGNDNLDADYSSGGTFNGGDGNDQLGSALSTNAILNGDAGDDTLFGDAPRAQGGALVFNGGTGYDTLHIDRNVNDFAIVKKGETVFLFYADYKATITGIERFYFYDGETGSREFTSETLGTNPDRATTVVATGNDYIDGLLDGEKWTDEITFSFGTGVGPAQVDSLGALFLGSYLHPGDEMNLPLTLYGSVASLVATSVKRSPPTSYDDHGYPRYANDGDIRFQNGTGFDQRYFANPPSIGSVLFNSAQNDLENRTRVGNEQHFVYLQAAGRALGLKSASEVGGIADVAVPADKDSLEYTVMSDRSYVGGPAGDYTNGQWDFPQTFMVLDIQALQVMYGADYSTNATATTYKWDATGAVFVNGVRTVTPGANKIFLTIWDGGGSDTYDFSNYTEAMSIDLSPGGYSRFSQAQLASLGDGVHAKGNIYNAYLHNNNPASLIENARGGSGNDTLRGNIADNVLNGGGGADTMAGLAGNDRYIVDNAGDVVVEAANEGIDRVIVRIADYVLPAHVEEAFAEEGTLATDLRGNELGNLLRGNQGGNELYGGAGADRLEGLSGNDHLDGGTGPDQMIGGKGNDTYIVDHLSDVVFEKPNEGTDTLWTSVNRGLDNDFENIVLFGTATDAGGNGKSNIVSGNGLNNNLYGGGGSDSLYGHDGSDRLFGEDGNDYMTGGKGTDAYYGGLGYDYAILEEGGGVDYFVDWNVARDRVVFDSAIFSSIGAAMSAAFQNGSDVVIWDGHDGIVLQNAKLADLTNSNFLIT